jgi:RNA polymerase sigma-70 factor (ECF subfamily)
MTPLDRFQEHRRALVAIAYRMLSSSAEAEDAVQDAWIRWQSLDHATILDDRAWLATALVRICVDRLTSAHARRETYPGTWLPEPVLTTSPVDLESISLGFLVLLERLTPVERAVFLLHQVFDYSHAEIGEILGTNETASRQSLHRAKQHVAAGRPRFDSSRETHERLLQAFMGALSRGDVASIASVLAEDATLYGDGGGKVRGAIRRPILGGDRVARFFSGLLAKTPTAPDLVVEVKDVNGWPALVGRTSAGISFVITIETDGTRITTIRNVVNPEKLVLRHVD